MLQDIIAPRLDALKTSYARVVPTPQNGDKSAQGGRQSKHHPPMLGGEDKQQDYDGAAINPPLFLGGEPDGNAEDDQMAPPLQSKLIGL
jgi:hypothetical protein